MLSQTEIAMAPYQDCCAHAAIFNLYKLRGLTPPSFDEVEDSLQKQISASRQLGAARIGNQDAPTTTELLNMLAERGFVCGVIVVPPAYWSAPQELLTRFLDQGCVILLSYNWRWRGADEVISHVVVADGYDQHGYSVLDGEPGYRPPGRAIELEPEMPSPEEMERVRQWLKNNSHGSRKLMPFFPIGTGAIVNGRPVVPLGLIAHVIVVYPAQRQSNGETINAVQRA